MGERAPFAALHMSVVGTKRRIARNAAIGRNQGEADMLRGRERVDWMKN
jgi:hypothetical protein